MQTYQNITNLLKKAAEDFFYYDPSLEGWTVIAGSPHFDPREKAWLYNWGRDTMIALPGLCLATQRWDLYEAVLENYLRFIHRGLLPNFIGDGKKPQYNSIDATFWMFSAIEKYREYTKNKAFFEKTIVLKTGQRTTILKLLEDIVECFLAGIHFEDEWEENEQKKSAHVYIYVDPEDGLVVAGSPYTQLTWMDARPQGKLPITSRHGKTVEINALWWKALLFMDSLTRPEDGKETQYRQLATQVESHFGSFWNRQQNCLYDTLAGSLTQGRQVRPNQIFAVGEAFTMEQNKAIADRVERELLTPYGLRTLSPKDPAYHGTHTDETSYHQGTIWPWLIGGFVEACVFCYGPEKTRQMLTEKDYFRALEDILESLKTLPEIWDGDADLGAPYNPKGCRAQAWSVAETYRAMHMLGGEERV